MAISDNTRGAVLMTGSMAAFTFNDACMKALSDELPFFQALFMRGVGTIILLALLAHAFGALRLRLTVRDTHLVLLRMVAEVGAAYFFITALFNASIANVTAVIQATPLSITLAGALFLGEPAGWRRLSAILVGFIGVLLIVRPGTEGFDIYAFYALIAVGCVTLRDLATRQLSAAVPSLTVALSGAVGVTLFAATGAVLDDWRPVSALAGLQLVGATLFIIGGYLFSVMVMRVGEIGFIAPFRFTSLIWALVLGFFVFGDWPDALTLAGSAIIVLAGVTTLYRERKLAAA